jgi:serine/threonine protein phosphatase PrpC
MYSRQGLGTVLVVACICDGIWNVLGNQECLDLMVSILFQEGASDVGLIAKEVLDTTCLKKGSRDNMTIIVVKFLAPLNPLELVGVSRNKRIQQHKV